MTPTEGMKMEWISVKDMEIEEKDGYIVYRPKNYPGPIAIDMTPSEACREYHRNAEIQINTE